MSNGGTKKLLKSSLGIGHDSKATPLQNRRRRPYEIETCIFFSNVCSLRMSLHHTKMDSEHKDIVRRGRMEISKEIRCTLRDFGTGRLLARPRSYGAGASRYGGSFSEGLRVINAGVEDMYQTTAKRIEMAYSKQEDVT